MDENIGRFLTYLERRGLAENTIFVVTSDNGPEPSNPIAEPDFERWMQLRGGYSRRLDNLGERGSFVFIGPEWANATSAGALYKFTTGEGGLRVPLVMAGPGIAPQRIDARTFVTDIAPTLLERAGVATPGSEFDGVSLNALFGQPSASARSGTASIGVEVSGHAALYRGDFKIVRTPKPLGDGAWRLYNVTQDPGETHDLADEQPELLNAMRADYAAYEKRVGVQPLPDGYDVQRQVVHNTRLKTLQHYWWLLALGALVLFGVSVLVARLVGARLGRLRS